MASKAITAKIMPSPKRNQKLISIIPVNWPTARRMIGKIRKMLRYWDSSMAFAFAEPRTIIIIAIKEIAGETNSIKTIQLISGSIMLPNQIHGMFLLKATASRLAT